MLLKPAVLIVRIKEYSYNIGWSEVGLLVVLTELYLSNIKGCYKVSYARLAPPRLKIV
jgi:hypothetical protein